MKKFALILTLFLFLPSLSFGYYSRTYLPALIEKADVIVYGQIVSVNMETIQVLVVRRMKGFGKQDTLTVKQFKNWTCAGRYAEYTVGQKALFFLTRSVGIYTLIGDGNEGELVVKSDSAYVEDYGQKQPPGQEYGFMLKHTKYIKLDLKTVLKGLAIYLESIDQIAIELNTSSEGTTAYQYSYIDKLPKNDFLNIIIDQRQRGYR